MGYETNNSVKNLGSLLILMGLRVMQITFLFILYFFRSSFKGKMHKLYTHLKKENLFNGLIDLYLSAYPEFLLGAVLAILSPSFSLLSGELASFYLAWVNISACIILLPTLALVITFSSSQKVMSP